MSEAGEQMILVVLLIVLLGGCGLPMLVVILGERWVSKLRNSPDENHKGYREPVSRERQIEMMEKHQERVEKRVQKLLRVPVIRESISRPHPKQGERKTFVAKPVRAAAK